MPSIERQTVSFKDVLPFLLALLVGVAIGYVVFRSMSVRASDDRPPIIVSDGSIEIEEVESGNYSAPTGGKGTLETPGPVNGRSTWTHKHTKDKPKRLHALVEGADAARANNCPAVYFAQDITEATIVYSLNGAQRDVIVSKKTGNEPVEISVLESAGWNQSNGTHTLTLEPDTGAAMASVKLAWGNGVGATSVTCEFGTTPPRIVFLQTTK